MECVNLQILMQHEEKKSYFNPTNAGLIVLNLYEW